MRQSRRLQPPRCVNPKSMTLQTCKVHSGPRCICILLLPDCSSSMGCRQAVLTMDIVKRGMLGHSTNDIMNERPGLRAGTTGIFTSDDVHLYSNTFHGLLQEELRANLKQVYGIMLSMWKHRLVDLCMHAA